ncbi:hypothetical protein L1987_42682 [Smallanthus sonchifolius]|uniref:Uncharacterized protein n=1 Tax=Smallanthus sonchifolius TaxID=185202 RepID=A0ACB9GKA4_9ASTR|nr:hypothetical protein L1987_42682 [Smallanthus sonchifolius]
MCCTNSLLMNDVVRKVDRNLPQSILQRNRFRCKVQGSDFTFMKSLSIMAENGGGGGGVDPLRVKLRLPKAKVLIRLEWWSRWRWR